MMATIMDRAKEQADLELTPGEIVGAGLAVLASFALEEQIEAIKEAKTSDYDRALQYLRLRATDGEASAQAVATSAGIRRSKKQPLTTEIDTPHPDALSELEQMAIKARQAFRDAHFGFCYLDPSLRYVYVNPSLAAINGRSPAEHIGKTIMEVLPELGPAVEKELRQVLDTGCSVVDGTVIGETPGHPGETREYMHDFWPLRSGGRDIIGAACCVVLSPTSRGTGA